MNFDYSLFTKINGLAGHYKILDIFMLGMAKYCVLLYGLFLLIVWFKPGNRLENKKAALKAIITALVALGINQIIGAIYFRPRPFANHTVNMLVTKSPDPSFPSDHATGSSSLTLALISSNPLLGSIMSIFTILLMISRVYVGVHYPLDVLGGAFTGLIGTLIVNKLWPYLDSLADGAIKIYNKFIPV